MKNESNNNNLDEFLKGYLNDYGAAENGWNVPPDDLWESALPQFKANAPKAKFKFFGKGFPLFLVVVGGILGLLFQASLHRKELDQITNELNTIKQELSYVSGQVNESNTGPKQPTETVTIPLPPVKNYHFFDKDRTVDTQQFARVTGTKPNLEVTVNQSMASSIRSSEPNTFLQEFQSRRKPILERSSFARNPTVGIAPNQELTIDDQLGNVAPLATIDFSELKYQDTTTSLNRAVEIKRVIKGTPSIKLSLGTMQVNRFLDTIPEQFEDYVNHQYKGRSLGLNLELPLFHRWYLETGINYYHYSAESHHHRHIHYSNAIKDVPGLGPNDFQVQKRFHSAIGHVATTLVLTRAPSSPEPKNDIDISFDSDTHAHYLGLPLAFKYKLRIGRLGLFMRGGLLSSIRVHQQFQVKRLTTDTPNITFKYGERNTDIENVKRFHLQYLIGAGLDFHLSPHYALHFEPTFSRSLNPLSSIEGVQIGLQTIQFRGGLKLHF